jgi:hypothetical protein
MKVFVVRLNPDTRDCTPYSEYPTMEEYNDIHSSSPMNGFHEAVNFKSEKGVLRGYLPPKHLVSLRDGNPFTLITITAKTAKVDGDLIVGIQAGCQYVGETERIHEVNDIKSRALVWHYTCPESLSLQLDEPILGARGIVLGRRGLWVRGPTYKLNKTAIDRMFKALKAGVSKKGSEIKLKKILSRIASNELYTHEELEVESLFEADVEKALGIDSKNVVGNKFPSQKEVKSFQYVRDPKVVAHVLNRAKGKCNDCKKNGPFISKATKFYYLEVHHVVMLKDGGPDTVENTVALCPNCHRKRHYCT